ncbi:hypothetical protein H2203_000565 [Taxawa tesnikishii (nom. ined.)]|nr:hypothetical protein H2203_000565 [Dothideales sp. JES 119]
MPTDEELIEANRNRLLQRGDWLGLAPARPLRMNFEGSVARAHIGKRRKVHREGRAVMQPSETSPPAKKRHDAEYHTSGVLLLEDIQVNIGSQALASRVCGSEIQQPQMESSMMEHDSSDSMLLAAGDTVDRAAELNIERAQSQNSEASVFFESGHGNLTGKTTPVNDRYHEIEVDGSFIDELQPMSSVDGVARTDNGGHQGELRELCDSSFNRRPLNASSFLVGDTNCGYPERDQQTPQRFQLAFTSTSWAESNVHPPPHDRNQRHFHEHNATIDPSCDRPNFAKNDESWRKFLHLTDDDVGNDEDEFEDQHQQQPTALDVTAIRKGQSPSVSTPRGRGTQWTSTLSPISVSNADDLSEAQQSVPLSLQQWDALIAKDPAITRPTERKDEGEELWRKFVFGEGDESCDLEDYEQPFEAITNHYAPTQTSMAAELSYSSKLVRDTMATNGHGTTMYAEHGSSPFEEAGDVTPAAERSPSPGSTSNQPATSYHLLQEEQETVSTPPVS